MSIEIMCLIIVIICFIGSLICLCCIIRDSKRQDKLFVDTLLMKREEADRRNYEKI